MDFCSSDYRSSWLTPWLLTMAPNFDAQALYHEWVNLGCDSHIAELIGELHLRWDPATNRLLVAAKHSSDLTLVEKVFLCDLVSHEVQTFQRQPMAHNWRVVSDPSLRPPPGARSIGGYHQKGSCSLRLLPSRLCRVHRTGQALLLCGRLCVQSAGGLAHGVAGGRRARLQRSAHARACGGRSAMPHSASTGGLVSCCHTTPGHLRVGAAQPRSTCSVCGLGHATPASLQNPWLPTPGLCVMGQWTTS